MWLFYYLLLPTLLLTGMRKFGVPARGELGVAWPCSWSCGSAYPQAPANFIKRLQTRRSVGDDVPTQPRPTIRRSVPGFSAGGCCPLTNIVFSATSCQCEGYWEQAVVTHGFTSVTTSQTGCLCFKLALFISLQSKEVKPCSVRHENMS